MTERINCQSDELADYLTKQMNIRKGDFVKPIFLATCYFQPNYGSMLQAYATQEFLNNNLVPNQTININGLMAIIRKRKLDYFKRNIFHKDVVLDKMSYLNLIVNKKINVKLEKNIRIRQRVFREFSQTHFALTEEFKSFEELSNACERRCEAVLVGSDQLWLPSNIEADYYTLNFVPDNIKKIAYATSFGVSSLPKKQVQKAIQFLNRFDYLSVREQFGKAIIEKLIGKTSQVVCDPVILLTVQQWKDLIREKKCPGYKYIFCYLLGKEIQHYLWVRELAKTTGCKVIGLTNLDTYIKIADEVVDDPLYNADPFDFVNLIINAEYVCTDSYHATVFSLMFHKRVFTFRRFLNKSTMSTNGRLESLFSSFNNNVSFVSGDSPISNALGLDIDYEVVDSVLFDLRQASVEYLAEALNVELH